MSKLLWCGRGRRRTTLGVHVGHAGSRTWVTTWLWRGGAVTVILGRRIVVAVRCCLRGRMAEVLLAVALLWRVTLIVALVIALLWRIAAILRLLRRIPLLLIASLTLWAVATSRIIRHVCR